MLRLPIAVALVVIPIVACSSSQTSSSTVPSENEVNAYHAYLVAQIDGLVAGTGTFVAAIQTSNFDQAKVLYAPSRQFYESIEPIAKEIPDLDTAIDARESDIVPPATWQGFHRLEKGLWGSPSVADLGPVASRLKMDVQTLRDTIGTINIGVSDLVTGASELMDEVSSSKVAGGEEVFSHTDLFDFVGNEQGSREIFDILKPNVTSKNAALVQTLEKSFKDWETLLASFKVNGSYLDYGTLTDAQKTQIVQAVTAVSASFRQFSTLAQ